MTSFATADPARERAYARDLARGFGGALIFAFPLLMTMEMWRLGFEMDRGRLALFLALSAPLLYGLSVHAGFRATRGFRDDALDALAALAVGFVTAAVLLALFGVLEPGLTVSEAAGVVALLAVPGAIGALLARRQLSGGGGGEDDPDQARDARPRGPLAAYAAELFLMAVGALFVVFNVAPTEEVVLIAHMMSPWHALALAALSVAVLHAMVYAVGFAGQEAHDRPWLAFWHFTVVGYALALVVGLYVQWTFGHMEGQSLPRLVATTLVLGFPGALGAGAARLLV